MAIVSPAAVSAVETTSSLRATDGKTAKSHWHSETNEIVKSHMTHLNGQDILEVLANAQVEYLTDLKQLLLNPAILPAILAIFITQQAGFSKTANSFLQQSSTQKTNGNDDNEHHVPTDIRSCPDGQPDPFPSDSTSVASAPAKITSNNNLETASVGSNDDWDTD